MSTRLCYVIICSFLLLISSITAFAQDECYSRDQAWAWGLKTKLAGDTMQISRYYFQENGFCPPAIYIEEQLKLRAQHPDIFNGGLHILQMTSSASDTASSMSQVEKESYIFYYGDETGLVAVAAYQDSLSLESIITDEGNMSQICRQQEQEILKSLRNFAQAVIDGQGDPEDLINYYSDMLIVAPTPEARAQLRPCFLQSLGHFYQDIIGGQFTAKLYAYQLGRLQAAVIEEYRDSRNQRLLRRLQH